VVYVALQVLLCHFFKVQSGEKLGKVIFKKGKYYIYSAEVFDRKDNLFFKDKQ